VLAPLRAAVIQRRRYSMKERTLEGFGARLKEIRLAHPGPAPPVALHPTPPQRVAPAPRPRHLDAMLTHTVLKKSNAMTARPLQHPLALLPPLALATLATLVALTASACTAAETNQQTAESTRPNPDYSHQLLPRDLHGDPPPISDEFLLTIDAERVALTRDYFEIHNGPLFQSLPDLDAMESIRFDPAVVVVHYTVTESLAQTAALFGRMRIDPGRGTVARNGDLNVGIQFMVDRDGRIYSSYPENVMSRHVIGLNHVAIGIENIGNADYGQEGGNLLPMTPAQLDANLALIRYLGGKYPNLRFMIGHSEYRDFEDPAHPGHDLFQESIDDYRTVKTDPGTEFMRLLRAGLSN
jgi:N-acetylmuramoyl-L-alanine amidase